MVELLRVQTNFTGDAVNGPAVSHHYFLAGETPQGAANAIHGFWQALDNEMSNQLNFQIDSTVLEIESTTGLATGDATVTSALDSGTLTGNLMPLATQGQIQWRTNSFVNGRRLQGRTFVPGPTTNVGNSDGTPTSAYLSGLAAAATLLTANPNFVVYSPTHKTFAVVPNARVLSKFAVLRSRRD